MEYCLLQRLKMEVQQLLGCVKENMFVKPHATTTWDVVVQECLTYMPGKPAQQCFVRKSPVMEPWDKGIRERIRIIFPGRRFKVCYSYSQSIPKRLPRSVYLKSAAN